MNSTLTTLPVSLRDLSEIDRAVLRAKIEDALGVQNTTMCKGGTPCTIRPLSADWTDEVAAISLRYQRVTVVESDLDEIRLVKAMSDLVDRTACFDFAGSSFTTKVISAQPDLEVPPEVDMGVAYTVTARLVVSFLLTRTGSTAEELGR